MLVSGALRSLSILDYLLLPAILSAPLSVYLGLLTTYGHSNTDYLLLSLSILDYLLLTYLLLSLSILDYFVLTATVTLK